MPEPMFPEITLPAPAALPPIVALSPSMVRADPLGRATVPVMSVPIRLPWMIVPSADSTPRPTEPFPEIRFPEPGDVPPIVLLSELMMRIPWPPGEAPKVPVASVPM
jgi:hypothetical protein